MPKPFLPHKALYAAFDQFPGSKGAATHIAQMASNLFEYCGGGYLFTLGTSRSLPFETEGPISVERFVQPIPNYLERGLVYSKALSSRVSAMPSLELVHFRDVWSGVALLDSKRSYKSIFEINGLPSIELPYRYNCINEKTLAKIRQMELYCCERADGLVVPSNVIKTNLMALGIGGEKIDVVPNGADITPEFASVKLPEDPYIIYFGALQSWQGVDVLIKAFAMLKDLPIKLMIVSSNSKKFLKPYRKLVETLGITDNVLWQMQINKPELNTYIKHAKLSIAPLRACSRNIEQGCSPLKIFESLACGTPVVASKLPVVEEILQDKLNARLFEVDRPQSLARIIRFLLESPKVCEDLAAAGSQLIQTQYNWHAIKQKLFNTYKKVNVYGT